MADTNTSPRERRPVSRLTCAQCERMVLDAVDGTLGEEDRLQFDLHVGSCAECMRALSDAKRGLAWMEMLRAAPPEPPEGLVAEILARTSGDPAIALPVLRADSLLHPVPGANVLPFRVPAAQRLWARLPLMAQPRFAMTAAMAFFSVALTLNLTGVHLANVRLTDLKPSSLRRGFWDANARAVRYYDNLRVVYELQSRVRELQRQSDVSRSDGSSRQEDPSTGDGKGSTAPAPDRNPDPKNPDPKNSGGNNPGAKDAGPPGRGQDNSQKGKKPAPSGGRSGLDGDRAAPREQPDTPRMLQIAANDGWGRTLPRKGARA